MKVVVQQLGSAVPRMGEDVILQCSVTGANVEGSPIQWQKDSLAIQNEKIKVAFVE